MMSKRESKIKFKWEYKSFHCFLSFNEYRVNNGVGTGSIEISEYLNMLGEEGWELVSTMQKVTDYEQLLGGSGHPVAIKAHKNTGYEFIMKRQIFNAVVEQEAVHTALENTALIHTDEADLKTSNKSIDQNSEIEDFTDDISIEDLTEASRSLAEEVETELTEEINSPLLEGPFYSNDSSESTSTP